MSDVPLREFLELQVQALRELLLTELGARDRQAREAETELNRRLSEMNELRKQIERERGEYVLNTNYQQRHEDLDRRIKAIEDKLSGAHGRTEGITTTVGWLIAGAGVAVAVVALVIAKA